MRENRYVGNEGATPEGGVGGGFDCHFRLLFDMLSRWLFRAVAQPKNRIPPPFRTGPSLPLQCRRRSCRCVLVRSHSFRLAEHNREKRVSSFPLVSRTVGILLRTLSSKSDDHSMINQAVADPIRSHAAGLISSSQAEAGSGFDPSSTTARESEVSSDPARILRSTSPRWVRDHAESWTRKVVNPCPNHSASRESLYLTSQAVFAAN